MSTQVCTGHLYESGNRAKNAYRRPIAARLCYAGSTLNRDTPEPNLDGSALRIAVIVARFNEHITSRLLKGALKAAERCGVKEHTVNWVPGAFELPVVAWLLGRTGLIDHKDMIGFFRYSVVAIFVVSAFLTPPDVISQLLMAGPLLLLYGLSIVIVWATSTKER